MNELKTQKLSRIVGAEVMGVDRGRLLHDGDLPEVLTAALEENGVLVFRGLDLDDETQAAFCRRLGEVVTFPGNPVPEIFEVSWNPENPYAKYLRSTVAWHIDGTVDPVPAKATMLSAKVLSAEGGETEFASTYAAYDDLSGEEKRRFAGLRVWHSREAVHRDAEAMTPEQLAEMRKQDREHPLVWTHQTGRKSLVLGQSADYVVGMDVEEGRGLLSDLLTRATMPERVYRHTWSAGDTVIWDNRGILHRVRPFDPASRRELHRTTLVGDEPIQ
jgi:alpha-ketoglutarate-dependent taurine dioxygenase